MGKKREIEREKETGARRRDRKKKGRAEKKIE